MRQFPAFFNMDDASVVVFGGGEEARRKVRLLAATPAHITVIVNQIDPGFAEEFAGRITIAPLDHAGPALDVARFAIVANRLDQNAERAINMAPVWRAAERRRPSRIM
jgi:uroporphyrin-III C-methyltransferase/precorrin-2 dehydrogenase/sirohydrochlorin ferrochelatase